MYTITFSIHNVDDKDKMSFIKALDEFVDSKGYETLGMTCHKDIPKNYDAGVRYL